MVRRRVTELHTTPHLHHSTPPVSRGRLSRGSSSSASHRYLGATRTPRAPHRPAHRPPMQQSQIRGVVGVKRGRTELETCELNGWGVGTRLIGDEGWGPAVIEVTYFTREGSMLAICHERNGKAVSERETSWTLACRDWTEVAR